MQPDQILTEADRCVKCGLCLPNCPTYRATLNEGDSPRGRIALIQALAAATLESPRLHRHLDRCLGCRACEESCPSGVRYGLLLDAAREIQRRQGRGLNRHLLELISRLPYSGVSAPLLALYRHSGLRRLVRRLGGKRLQRLDRLLPGRTGGGWQPDYRPPDQVLGRVGLFTGCVGRLADRPALDAAIRVLNRLGLEVVVPPGQGCCGALHQHNGMPGRALTLAAGNRRAFNGRELEAVLYLASGCGAQLHDYPGLGEPFDAPVMDISRFLCGRIRDREHRFRPLPRRVLLHTPCSQRNILREPDAAGPLLQQIPELDLCRLPDGIGCCGAAGSYLLTQPAMADRLRRRTLEAVAGEHVEILVTSNTGCALHLAAGLEMTGSPVRVMHPVELFEQQLESEAD
ncbi:MAG TPA: (Fe-S)-binding protein [Sedimenticola sp.]|nr:(Fe-S)-binding protein [Sedimenticola sp.]